MCFNEIALVGRRPIACYGEKIRLLPHSKLWGIRLVTDLQGREGHVDSRIRHDCPTLFFVNCRRELT